MQDQHVAAKHGRILRSTERALDSPAERVTLKEPSGLNRGSADCDYPAPDSGSPTLSANNRRNSARSGDGDDASCSRIAKRMARISSGEADCRANAGDSSVLIAASGS